MRARLLLLAVLAVVPTACVAPGADAPPVDEAGGLSAPTFAPLPSAPSTATPDGGAASAAPASPAPTSAATSPAGTAPTGSASTATATAEPPSRPSPPPPTAAAPVGGRLHDGTGDLRGVARTDAPDHADLREAALEMAAGRGTIRIDFAGPAPERGPSDEILNVATYHDITGDGRVDVELWASLTADGWGTSWYDLRAGTARFAAEDEVDVAVRDGTLVLTFPASHLDGARSGQWLASSEWGTSTMMNTGASVTDDAPDDRSGRPWPG